MLLGAELFYKILRPGKINLGAHLPIMQETLFGWICSLAILQGEGPINSVNLVTQLEDLNELIPKFWRLEELTTIRTLTVEEKESEQHFRQTMARTQAGRYLVKLPFRNNSLVQLGESKALALNRFLSLERRLSKNPQLYKKYTEFMQEYIRLGHMEVADRQIETRGFQGRGENFGRNYYIPHHPVINDNSRMTKLRVVFDASMKTTTGISLNDCILVGPMLQSDLVSILINFRRFRCVLTTDIKMIYRQILVAPEQIFWRNNSMENLGH